MWRPHEAGKVSNIRLCGRWRARIGRGRRPWQKRPSRSARAMSVDALDDGRPEARERPHVPDAVPRVRLAGTLALRLVSLEEARHEELPGQRGQANTPGSAVVDDAVR